MVSSAYSITNTNKWQTTLASSTSSMFEAIILM
jgi:hypothetical protein